MVADDDINEPRRNEVENQIKDMVAPGVVTGDGIIDGESDDEDWTDVHVLPHRRKGEGIGEKQRNVPQAPDRGVTGDSIAVIEVKADTETICVRNGEPGSEQSEKQEGELLAGRNFKSHEQMLCNSFHYQRENSQRVVPLESRV